MTVRAFGSIEAVRTASSYCEVEGAVKILSIVPDGTKVTKGQIVCKLDSGALEDALIAQEVTVNSARGQSPERGADTEVAELGVKEYMAANPNLKETTDIAGGDLDAVARTKKLNELRSDVEKAQSDELAKKATLDLEQVDSAQGSQDDRELHFPRCDGRYRRSCQRPDACGSRRSRKSSKVRPSASGSSSSGSLTSTVRCRPTSSWVKRTWKRCIMGSRADVMVDALGTPAFSGTVVSIAALADPKNIFAAADTALYTTKITIDKPPPALQPGMLAHADILITELDGVLAVPVESVLDFDGKDHVAVKTADGRFEWREVTRGVSNGTLVELKSGVKAGERVAVKALSLWNKPKTQP